MLSSANSASRWFWSFILAAFGHQQQEFCLPFRKHTGKGSKLIKQHSCCISLNINLQGLCHHMSKLLALKRGYLFNLASAAAGSATLTTSPKQQIWVCNRKGTQLHWQLQLRTKLLPLLPKTTYARPQLIVISALSLLNMCTDGMFNVSKILLSQTFCKNEAVFQFPAGHGVSNILWKLRTNQRFWPLSSWPMAFGKAQYCSLNLWS